MRAECARDDGRVCWQERTLSQCWRQGHGRAAQFLGLGSTGTIALKKASADRIKELLGVLNYVAAPVGTTEALLLQVKDWRANGGDTIRAEYERAFHAK